MHRLQSRYYLFLQTSCSLCELSGLNQGCEDIQAGTETAAQKLHILPVCFLSLHGKHFPTASQASGNELIMCNIMRTLKSADFAGIQSFQS